MLCFKFIFTESEPTDSNTFENLNADLAGSENVLAAAPGTGNLKNYQNKLFHIVNYSIFLCIICNGILSAGSNFSHLKKISLHNPH